MGEQSAPAPPVRFMLEMPAGPRARLTALARPLLIIPHVLLVGGPAFCFLGFVPYRTGAFGGLAWLTAVFDWFAILFHEGPLKGMEQYKREYLRWRARTLAYGAFLRDEYPPFGDGDYPAALSLPEYPAARDKGLILLRPLLVLPHILWLLLLLFVWGFVGVFSWLWIAFTGALPESVWRFSRDVMGYSLRVEAYALLMHDEFPSFSLRAPDGAVASREMNG